MFFSSTKLNVDTSSGFKNDRKLSQLTLQEGKFTLSVIVDSICIDYNTEQIFNPHSNRLQFLLKIN